MTCSLVTPWWRSREAGAAEVDGAVEPTRILDWEHPLIGSLLDRVHDHRSTDPVALLQVAHRLIVESVRPVYAVDDAQPISRTLGRGRGSCSQRLAVLEGVARACGIPTRVRGLVVDGRFWYPRFTRLRQFVPDRVLLAWPEFHLSSEWVQAGELFGSLRELSASATGGFTNADGETLFEAIARTAVDWDGVTCPAGSNSRCDLSANIVADLGRFTSRDALFHAHGQTLCRPLTKLSDPVLSRWAPRAPAAGSRA